MRAPWSIAMSQSSRTSLPQIVLAAQDHDRLVNIAMNAMRRDRDVAQGLLSELDRAVVVDDGSLPSKVVRMESQVTFRIDGGETRTVTLVFPLDADMDRNRLSVLTPVGAALIGLARGQSIAWVSPQGQTRQLEVIDVVQPQADAAA
jgi:regulator of nucleoside diphosphate kinase